MAGLAWSAPVSCVARSMRGTRVAQTRTGCGVLTASASERNSICSVIVPADGTRAATVGSGDFGTSPLCLGSSRASRCLPVADEVGSRT